MAQICDKISFRFAYFSLMSVLLIVPLAAGTMEVGAAEARVAGSGGTAAGASGTRAFEDSKRLYAWLLSRERYNRLVRPLGVYTEQLTVYLGLRLSQLIDVVCAPFILKSANHHN